MYWELCIWRFWLFFYSFQRFKDNDIEVKRKDGIILLRELAAEVKNFMDFKRNAVMVSEKLQIHCHTNGPLPYYT